jgi:hypothetical protein
MNKSKYSKLIFFSLLSWLLYYGINNWDRINRVLESNEVGSSSRTFEIFLIISIIKFFLLLFGVISIIFLIIQLFKKKE